MKMHRIQKESYEQNKLVNKEGSARALDYDTFSWSRFKL